MNIKEEKLWKVSCSLSYHDIFYVAADHMGEAAYVAGLIIREIDTKATISMITAVNNQLLSLE